jgi:putative GTP pyrophosphokinase
LQHAWAEIEHDRNYKFSGILPKGIQRRFNLLAGTLELVDNEFEQISEEIEKYSQEVSAKTKIGELNIPINSTSLTQYMTEKFEAVPLVGKTFADLSSQVIEELKLE